MTRVVGAGATLVSGSHISTFHRKHSMLRPSTVSRRQPDDIDRQAVASTAVMVPNQKRCHTTGVGRQSGSEQK